MKQTKRLLLSIAVLAFCLGLSLLAVLAFCHDLSQPPIVESVDTTLAASPGTSTSPGMQGTATVLPRFAWPGWK